MAVEFADVDGLGSLPRIANLELPREYLNILHRKDMKEAEKWLRQNDEHPLLQPYRVTLHVQENRFSTDLKPVTYFLRGPRHNPELADNPEYRNIEGEEWANDGRWMAQAADILWHAWEGPRPEVEGDMRPEFPDTVDFADVMTIDVGDWMEYLRAAHKYAKDDTPYQCIGAPRYPLHWTCKGMAFLDDQEAHKPEEYYAMDAYASQLGYDTRGGIVE